MTAPCPPRAGGTEGQDKATGAGPSPHAIRRVAANALALLLAYALPRLFTVAAVVVAARVLGASAFGAYGTAAAFAVILSILATLGMSPLLIRDMARRPDRAGELTGAAHRVKTVSNAAMIVAVVVLARWVLRFPDDVSWAALLLAAAYAVGAYAENLAAYFQAVERMHVWTQASALYGLLTGATGAALVLVTSSMVWFCVAPVVGQCAALAWLLVRAPPEVRRPPAPRPGDVVGLVRSLAPFAAAFVVLTVYYKVDVLLLAHWRPAADVGIYTAAYKFVDVAQALAVVAVAATYPRLSRAVPTGAGGGAWAGTRLAELAVLGVVPAAGLLWLAREAAVVGLFGPEYAQAAPVLGFLAAALPALVLNILAGYVLGAAGRMYHVAALYGCGLGLNVGLNVLLIPRFGPLGAGIAMLASETTLAVGLVVALRVLAAASPGGRAWAAAAVGVGLVGAAAALPGTAVTVQGLAYAGAVVAAYAVLRVVPGAERRALREALGAARPTGRARSGGAAGVDG